MWVAVVLGCTGGEPATAPSGSDSGAETPGPGSPPEETVACAVDPEVAVVDVSTRQPWHENELALTVQLSVAASLAVTCTSADDPREVHLVEAAVPSAAHSLRLSGLLAATDYDCVAAPVCPQAAAVFPFTVTTGDAGPFQPRVDIETTGDAGSDYILFNHSRDCEYDTQRLLVVDREGRVRWWYETPPFVGPSVEFRYHGANRFAWGGGWEPNALGRPRVMDLFDGEIRDSADALPDVAQSAFHHDGKQLPDGRLLTLEQVSVEGSDGRFDGFRVRRIDPVTGTVDFDYHSQRAFDEGWLPAGSGDAWHANWVDIVDDTLYVSLCFVERVIAIDVATGDWKWTFGRDGDFALSDATGAPLGDDEFPSCQHGLEIRDDHLLVYDNGIRRGASRVAEYALDEEARTAQLLWSWTEPDWYESTLGDADWLPNGHVLVNAGHSECFSESPGDRTTIWEVDPVAGEKVWELRYRAVGETAYRADSADSCALFANAAYCPRIGERLAALEDVLGR